MSIAESPELITLPLDQIKPYDKNPRRISQEAVDAVKTSIERYGYQQPIVVDKDYVIVVGHTRLQALQQLGVTEAPVYVTRISDEKVREYRLIDNRTGEMSSWDQSQLILELREWEAGLLGQYFPDIDLEIVSAEDKAVTQRQIDEAIGAIEDVPTNKGFLLTTVVCPSCFHEFEVSTASLPGLNRLDIDELSERGGPQ